jgi:phosphatidylinositol-3-phosphatase
MFRRPRVWTTIAIAVGLLASTAGIAAGHTGQTVTTTAARIRHVFIIVLENKNFDDTFSSSTQDPYLQKTLVPMGGLLTQYYGTGHASLDNYLSLLSGQASTVDTSNDCVTRAAGRTGGNFDDMVQTGTAPHNQVISSGGCVYPAHVRTLANQMDEARLTWKGYMEDMGNDPARESATCGRPAIGVGTDHTNAAEAPSTHVPEGDAYATRHNPFVYFRSIIDNAAVCQKQVVNLKALDADLRSARSTPNLVFITPNLCNDGHDGSGTGEAGKTCVDGKPGGLTSADAFLQTWVPKILASQAYKKDGLLIVTFDEGNYTRTVSTDAATGKKIASIVFPGQSCCHQQPGPNLAQSRPATLTLMDTPTVRQDLVFDGFGGDRIGALLLSPFIRPGSVSDTPYNHYSLLRSLEDIFVLREHLGYAENDPATGYHLDTIGNDTHIFGSRG